MKNIKEIINSILEKNNLFIDSPAIEYNNFVKSWPEIIETIFNNQSEISKHVKIKDLKNNIIIIESDHSGWMQLLQSKQNEILNVINVNYKKIAVKSISFVLERHIP